jgi:hypothetical protein
MIDLDGRSGLIPQGAEAAARDRCRLDRLADSMVTPWQLAPLASHTDAAATLPTPAPLQPPQAKVAETDFVVVWQLRPATRATGQNDGSRLRGEQPIAQTTRRQKGKRGAGLSALRSKSERLCYPAGQEGMLKRGC